MQLSDAILSENENFRFISVVFPPYTGEKEYTYKTVMPLEVDDYVVVSTPGNKFQVVKVRDVLNPLEVEVDPAITYKWVVAKVDMTHYEECVAMEEQLAEQLRKAALRKRQAEIKSDVMEFLTEDERQAAVKLVRL